MSDRDLPVALPIAEWPRHSIAQAALTFGWKRARLPGTGIVEWFRPDGKRLGQFDEEKNEVWLSTELADNETELLRTVGHEVEHAVEHHHGHGALFDEKRAALAGDRFIKLWDEYIADLHAKALASGTAREPFQRYFGGSSFDADAAFDPRPDLSVEARPTPPARARYAYE